VPTLDVDGTDVSYERRGAGEPVPLLPGLEGDSLHWREG
jgi:hypothetical protein